MPLCLQVVRLIQQKQSQVIFVVTGDCGNETLSQGFAVFELISATSSGQVFRLKKKDVNQVLKFVEESVQANRVNLLSTDVGEAADRTYTVPVDNALQELTISVSGKDASLKLYDPAGSNMYLYLFTVYTQRNHALSDCMRVLQCIPNRASGYKGDSVPVLCLHSYDREGQ